MEGKKAVGMANERLGEGREMPAGGMLSTLMLIVE